MVWPASHGRSKVYIDDTYCEYSAIHELFHFYSNFTRLCMCGVTLDKDINTAA